MATETSYFNRLNLDNIEIICSSVEQVSDKLSHLIKNTNKENLIVTFNLDFYRNSEINPVFNNVCKSADFVFPDGVGITNLLKLKYGIKLKRITGNELFIILLSIADKNNLSVAFAGSTEKTLNKLKEKIQSRYPGLKICAVISPPLNFENDLSYNSEMIEKLKESKPDILFLALGSPRQELWLYENKEKIGAKINMGVGAVFDFYSGVKKRSPVIFQKIGLEWLWRLITEPGRLFKRYIIYDLPFFIKCAYKIITKK